MDGVTAITELARRGVPARVLVLTTYDTDSLRAARHRGGRHRLPAQGRAAGRAAARGPGRRAAARRCCRRRWPARLMGRVRAPAAGPLSQRELEVLGLVAARHHQPGGGRPAVHQRGHGQDPPAAHLRQARRQRPPAAVAEAFNRGLLTPPDAPGPAVTRPDGPGRRVRPSVFALRRARRRSRRAHPASR